MVILRYLHTHATPYPAGLDHSKNQEKYVLTTGNDLVTPHVWYLTGRKVQWDSLRQIMVLVYENAGHDCTNCANLQFVVYYCILHLPTFQVPYMRGYYIITSGQYIFFLIFRVIQTSRIWGSMCVQVSQNHHFRTF
jgi:hypothetical protein